MIIKIIGAAAVVVALCNLFTLKNYDVAAVATMIAVMAIAIMLVEKRI